MAHLTGFCCMLIITLIGFAPLLCLSRQNNGGFLYPQFYQLSCPNAQEIVKSVVAKAVYREPRMAASLLRLHFHDCFVKGCDASILLDSSGILTSEKRSNPNRNSARGFEVIDEIKHALERDCPHTVSCSDIMALAARDSTALTGGPHWEVPLGRRDSRDASLSGSNNNIPAPNNTFQSILTKFKLQGLDIVDLVALSGSHTVGNSRCTSFRQRLYNQSGNGQPDYMLDQSYAAQLRAGCPRSGGDQNLFVLDFVSPTKFDNNYFKNLLASKGLLSSDQILVTKSEASRELVKKYAENNDIFLEQFAKSMIKMGSHTIGNSRCTSFRQRLYNQSGNGQPDYMLDQSYAAQLRAGCPRSGGDQNLFVLDFVSPTKFDNNYFKNLLASKGLLSSDQILVTKSEASRELVKKYAENNDIFLEQFAKSMIKMGNITPLTGLRGEIRKHCRKINT